jgi:hypothetical protein
MNYEHFASPQSNIHGERSFMLSTEQRSNLARALEAMREAARRVADCRLPPNTVSNSIPLGLALSEAVARLEHLLQGS